MSAEVVSRGEVRACPGQTAIVSQKHRVVFGIDPGIKNIGVCVLESVVSCSGKRELRDTRIKYLSSLFTEANSELKFIVNFETYLKGVLDRRERHGLPHATVTIVIERQMTSYLKGFSRYVQGWCHGRGYESLIVSPPTKGMKIDTHYSRKKESVKIASARFLEVENNSNLIKHVETSERKHDICDAFNIVYNFLVATHK